MNLRNLDVVKTARIMSKINENSIEKEEGNRQAKHLCLDNRFLKCIMMNISFSF